MTTTKAPIDPVDTHVGARIKLRRTLLKISQEQLGTDIGVTFQQIQKYETGSNRVSASMMYRVATTLSIDIGFFFEGLEPTTGTKAAAADPMRSEIGMRLVRLVTRHLSPISVEHLLALLEGMQSRQIASAHQHAAE